MKKLFALPVFVTTVTFPGSSYAQAHDHLHGGDIDIASWLMQNSFEARHSL